MKLSLPLLSAVLTIACAGSIASAQQAVYPSKGQSPSKQQKDEMECNSWAVQQSGFNPASPPPPAAKPPVTGSGSRAKGAAAGAVVGGIAGNDVGHSAAVGAVAGGVAQRGANRRSSRQQQDASQQGYANARAACLQGRGYAVK